MRAKTSALVHMLNGKAEGGISGQVNNSFNRKKWNLCLEVEMPIIIHCKKLFITV